MSDTPLTDAAAMYLDSGTIEGEFVEADFARQLERELAELKRWKAEMLAVENQWDPQEIGDLLGMPLGSRIRSELKPRIEALKAELDTTTSERNTLRQAVEAVWRWLRCLVLWLRFVWSKKRYYNLAHCPNCKSDYTRKITGIELIPYNNYYIKKYGHLPPYEARECNSCRYPYHGLIAQNAEGDARRK